MEHSSAHAKLRTNNHWQRGATVGDGAGRQWRAATPVSDGALNHATPTGRGAQRAPSCMLRRCTPSHRPSQTGSVALISHRCNQVTSARTSPRPTGSRPLVCEYKSNLFTPAVASCLVPTGYICYTVRSGSSTTTCRNIMCDLSNGYQGSPTLGPTSCTTSMAGTWSLSGCSGKPNSF